MVIVKYVGGETRIYKKGAFNNFSNKQTIPTSQKELPTSDKIEFIDPFHRQQNNGYFLWIVGIYSQKKNEKVVILKIFTTRILITKNSRLKIIFGNIKLLNKGLTNKKTTQNNKKNMACERDAE